MNYEIYNEDCLEGMKKIAGGSVDCILTDLTSAEAERTQNLFAESG